MSNPFTGPETIQILTTRLRAAGVHGSKKEAVTLALACNALSPGLTMWFVSELNGKWYVHDPFGAEFVLPMYRQRFLQDWVKTHENDAW